MRYLVVLYVVIFCVACGNGDSSSSQVNFGEIRSVDGSGNNKNNPHWGRASIPLTRQAPVDYDDGVSVASGKTRAAPRIVSNALMVKQKVEHDPRGLSSFVWQWGQFLDHDISLTQSHAPREPMMISIPIGDHMFDPFNTGNAVIPFMRSIYDPRSGTDAFNPRQQINEISAYIDGSNVYGSDIVRAIWLRSGLGGRLKVSEGNLLPFNDGTQANHRGSTGNLFVAGDVRANEQSGLTAMHTLFVREHNRLADIYQSSNSEWDDEQIYQASRRYLIALLQNITYTEFLPALLGAVTLDEWKGYKRSTNPGIVNEFSTVLFRLGHSMIPDTLLRLDESASDITHGNLPLRDAFFNSARIIAEGGIEPLLRGLSVQRMDKIDLSISDSLRNFLFGAPGSGGMDLACLNIQRARDHGITHYNALRYYYGLEPVTSFEEISSNVEHMKILRELYGHIDNIDPWIGALAEDHIPGSSVGELIAVALVQQFEAIRDGDRFWYENDPNLSEQEKAEVRATSLSDIIKRNTSIRTIQANVFFAR